MPRELAAAELAAATAITESAIYVRFLVTCIAQQRLTFNLEGASGPVTTPTNSRPYYMLSLI